MNSGNKNYTRQDSILLDLLNEESRISFASLCFQYKVSERTMRNDLAAIRAVCAKADLHLDKDEEKRYFIRLSLEKDRRNAAALRQAIISKNKENHTETRTKRIAYLFKRIVLCENYIKIRDLADETYVSTSTISKDLVKVKERLLHYNLFLVNRPHYGICVKGNEKDIRACILDNGMIDDEVFLPDQSSKCWFGMLNDETYFTIQEIIGGIIDQEQFCIFYPFLNNLVTHVYLTVKRIFMNNPIKTMSLTDPKHYPIEYRLAVSIAEEVAKAFNIHIDQNEVNYIQYQLVGKFNSKSQEPDHEIAALCEAVLRNASDTYKLGFDQDGLLKKDLYLHLLSAKSRMEAKVVLRNPLLSTIKEQYPLAFEIALSSMKSEGNMMSRINENELGYIAVHFAASMDRMKNAGRVKKSVLLICVSGIGTARLMEAKLTQAFQDDIVIIKKPPNVNITSLDFTCYDLVLTTILIQTDAPNVMKVNSILTQSQLGAIREALFQDEKNPCLQINEAFRKDLFKVVEYAATQSGLLKQLCLELEEKEIVDKDFYEGVMARERCSCTAIGNHLAVPHSIRPLARVGAIYVCIVKNPLDWGESSDVRLIFLLAVKYSEAERLAEIYDLIVKIEEDKEVVGKLTACGSYEEFISVLENFQKEKGK